MNLGTFVKLFAEKPDMLIVDDYSSKQFNYSYRSIYDVRCINGKLVVNVERYHEENCSVTFGEFLDLFLHSQEFVLANQGIRIKNMGKGYRSDYIRIRNMYADRTIYSLHIDQNEPNVIRVYLSEDIAEILAKLFND